MRNLIEDRLSYTLAMVSRSYRDLASELLAPTGLHLGQNRLLQQLWEEDGLSQSRLAVLLGAKLPTITRMVGRMEASGFVQRRPSPTDARTTQVYLAEKGREVKAPVEKFWVELEERATANLDHEEEILLLHRLLMRVHANLEGKETGA
ncbi:hypothetical protein BH24ACT22_BH24ACT22_09540 [soil metagenome]